MRINSSEDAARAGLDHAELDIADADTLPAVFGKGFAAFDHQVGAKTQHVHRPADLVRNIIQRCLANQQKRITIGERNLVIIPAVARLRGARPLQWHMHQPHRLFYKAA